MTSSTTHLTILHSNDIHGRIEQLPFLSAMARSIRAEVASRGGHVLLWDAGDAEDRILLESDVTKGAAIVAMMSAAGYDAAAIGNSIGVTYGPENLAQIAKIASYPMMAANLVWSDTGQLVEGVVPYRLWDLGPARLGLVGLAAPSGAYSLFGARSYDPGPIVTELATHLRERGATIIAVLSHLGLDGDKALAESVDGIDLIVGGHTHTLLEEPLVLNGALIAQAGSYGSHLGQIDLEIDNASGRISDRTACVLPTAASQADAKVVEVIQTQAQEVQKLLGRFVGQTTTFLDVNYFQECALGNFVADVLRERMGTDVAFVTAGMLDEAIREGPITFGDLCRATSSTGNPGRAELTGLQILSALNHGLRPEVAQDRPSPMRGNPQGILQVSGLKVTYDPYGDPKEQVVEVLVGDEPLDGNRTYSVASTDWELGHLTEYVDFEPGDVRYDVPTILREAMEEYLGQHSPISIVVEGRMRPV
jgi:5'-nucleotidase